MPSWRRAWRRKTDEVAALGSQRHNQRQVPTPPAVALPAWHFGVMLAVCLLVYANCLGHAFVWDDQYLVVDNPQVKDLRRAGSWFVSDLFPPVVSSGYYRPLQAVTNALDYFVWGLTPAGFHLTNILLHACAVLLFYLFVRELLRSPRIALLAAVLWAVHPAHTEAIAYVSGRSDPLSACFLLAALLTFVVYRRSDRIRWLVVSSTCFALALLAREAALGLLLLLPLGAVASSSPRRRGSIRADIGWIVPYAMVAAAYLLVRRAVIVAPSFVGPPGDTPLGSRLLTMLGVLLRYVELLVVPIDLHMERLVPPATSFADPIVLMGFVLLVALVAIAVRVRRRAWPATFGIAWFLLALVPVANVWPLATFMAEHWLYVPSMGLFLVAAWGLDQLIDRGWPQPALTGAALAIVIWAGLSITRNRDWRDPVALYEATTRSAPHSARAWTNLASAYRDVGHMEQARVAYDRALREMANEPSQPARHHSDQQDAQELALVANIHQQSGRFADAEASYRAALARDPSLVSAYNNLGLTLSALGHPDDAEQAFATAVRLYPDFAAAHSNRGNVFFRRGDLPAAKAAYETAIRLNPEYAEAYNNLGSVYFKLGDVPRAADAYRHALALNPHLEEVRRNLQVVEDAMAHREG